MLLKSTFMALCLAFCTSAAAETAVEHYPCSSTEGGGDAMRECLSQEHEKAEAAMESALAELEGLVGSPDLVRQMHEAWRLSSNMDCGIEARQWEGGSLQGLTMSQCTIRVARARAVFLTELAADLRRP